MQVAFRNIEVGGLYRASDGKIYRKIGKASGMSIDGTRTLDIDVRPNEQVEPVEPESEQEDS